MKSQREMTLTHENKSIIILTFDGLRFPLQADILLEKFDQCEFDFDIIVILRSNL